MKYSAFRLGALTAALIVAHGPVHATNGVFMPGFGNRSIGMGGVGIAYGRDSLSQAANPANIVNTGMRGDLGVGIFNAERHACTGTATNQIPSVVFGGTTFYPSWFQSLGFDGCSESDSKYYVMPEMGMTMPLTERLHVGMAFVPLGGGATSYPYNFFSWETPTFSAPYPDEKLGVDLMVLQAPVTVAYKFNDNHAFGASLAFAVSRFRAFGLDAFVEFDDSSGSGVTTITSDKDHITNNGYDYAYGAGIKLGYLGEFLDDKLTLGLVYNSRTYMTKFDKYRGLFAEQGDFDLPASYGFGLAIKPMKNLVIAFDALQIKYSDIAAMGNRGPGSFTGDRTHNLEGLPSHLDPSKELGNDDGMGFGFQDQTVYKLGVQYGVNKRLLVRAGYNYGENPIADDQLTFATLAPANTERHYSVGFTYRASDELEVTGAYMYVPSNPQQSPLQQNIVGAATIDMHQNIFGLTMSWVLDPGSVALEEYGEGEWAGIDFDNWYGGFGFGQSQYRDVEATSSDTRAEGWKVYTGYQFNKYLGVEGGFANLNDMTATTGTTRTKMESHAWALTAVGSYPLTEKFSVIAKLGAAYVLTTTNTKVGLAMTQRSGDDGYQPNYGVGVSYALLDNFNLRAEWERFDLDDTNIDLMTAGFAMEF